MIQNIVYAPIYTVTFHSQFKFKCRSSHLQYFVFVYVYPTVKRCCGWKVWIRELHKTIRGVVQVKNQQIPPARIVKTNRFDNSPLRATALDHQPRNKAGTTNCQTYQSLHNKISNVDLKSKIINRTTNKN